MKFVSPHWLWLIALLPLVYLTLLWSEKKKRLLLSQFVSQSLWMNLIPALDSNARIRKARVGLLAFAFILIALARPQYGTHDEVVKVAGLDLMLVFDVSNSMNVEDVVPSRHKKAQHFIQTLMDRLEGDRVGLVAFAGSSALVSPLTTDLDYLKERVLSTGPDSIQGQGTDIGAGLETAVRALERGGEGIQSPEGNDSASHGIIVISDGEDHEGHADEVAKLIRKKGIRLYVLGVGTAQGGPIPVKDENGRTQGYKRDRSGQPIISNFHSEVLSDLASEAGGKYWTISNSESEINDLYQDLKSLNRSEISERRFTIYEERYQVPLLIAIVLIFIELTLPARKLAAVILLFCFAVESSYASEISRKSRTLEEYLQNQAGISALKEGKIEEAIKKFGAAQAIEPDRPEFDFNQGVVQKEAGNLDQAIDTFKRSGDLARVRGDSSMSAKSNYNLGGALAKKGDFKGGTEAYLSAIRDAKKAQDPRLEASARKNLELLFKEMKEQKQQQQQQAQANQKEEKSQQEKKNSENKGQNENQGKQPRETQNGEKEGTQQVPIYKQSQQRKDNFRSEKMKQEDAERVFSELSAKERELQEKLQKQNAKTIQRTKDW